MVDAPVALQRHVFVARLGSTVDTCSAASCRFHAFLREGELSDPEVDLVLFSSPQRRTTEKYAQLMLQILFLQSFSASRCASFAGDDF